MAERGIAAERSFAHVLYPGKELLNCLDEYMRQSNVRSIIGSPDRGAAFALYTKQ
jgi:hypothetical protein